MVQTRTSVHGLSPSFGQGTCVRKRRTRQGSRSVPLRHPASVGRPPRDCPPPSVRQYAEQKVSMAEKKPVDAQTAFDELARIVLSDQTMDGLLERVAELAKGVVPGA